LGAGVIHRLWRVPGLQVRGEAASLRWRSRESMAAL
jgi:hypothetical protein